MCPPAHNANTGTHCTLTMKRNPPRPQYNSDTRHCSAHAGFGSAAQVQQLIAWKMQRNSCQPRTIAEQVEQGGPNTLNPKSCMWGCKPLNAGAHRR